MLISFLLRSTTARLPRHSARKARWLKRLVISLVGLVAGSPVVRAQLITTLVTPTQPVRANSSIVVDVASLNRGDAPQKVVNVATLPGTFTLGGSTWPVELRASRETETVVAPNGFVLQPYTVSLPAGVSGQGTLRIPRPSADALNGTIDVAEDTNSPVSARAGSAGNPRRVLRVDEADSAVLGRTFAGRLNAHNPIYFVYGGGDQAAKFQLSFKYRAATFSENAETGTLSTLQFAYTQRSLWDITSSSSPFYDTSYMPEVFWEWYRLPKAGEMNCGSLLGLQSGFIHESNGRDGPDSRSLNSAYIRAVFTFGPHEGWNLKLLPEAWAYYGSLGDNADLKDYRGYTRLQGIFGKPDSVALRFSLNTGKDFNHFTYQLDFTVPVHVTLFDLSAFFHLQYFNGYGESLRSYSQKSDALRAGFSLSR
jgi:outer membrane phospholipase A